jgi:hypothetical protein
MKYIVSWRSVGLRSTLVMLVGGMMLWPAREGKAGALTGSTIPERSLTPTHPAQLVRLAQERVLQQLGISQG